MPWWRTRNRPGAAVRFNHASARLVRTVLVVAVGPATTPRSARRAEVRSYNRGGRIQVCRKFHGLPSKEVTSTTTG